MIVDIATSTYQSAQMRRAINKRAYNAPPDSYLMTEEMILTDQKQEVVDDMPAEQHRLYRARTGTVQYHVVGRNR